MAITHIVKCTVEIITVERNSAPHTRTVETIKMQDYIYLNNAMASAERIATILKGTAKLMKVS